MLKMEYTNTIWIIFLTSLSTYTGTGALGETACDVAIVCTTDSTFSFCVLSSDGTEEVFVGNYSCDSGEQCINDTTIPCNEVTTEVCACTSTDSSTTSTTAATTTEVTAVTAPAECTSASKYPSANCSEYYECVQILWWYNLQTTACSSGQAFSATELACVTNSSCNATTGDFVTEASTTVTSTTETQVCYCTSTTTESTTSTSTTTESTTPTTVTTTITTTTEAVTAPSSCTSAGKYPSTNCNEYYECVAVMWWYDLVTQTCDSGQAYDETEEACVTDSSCT